MDAHGVLEPLGIAARQEHGNRDLAGRGRFEEDAIAAAEILARELQPAQLILLEGIGARDVRDEIGTMAVQDRGNMSLQRGDVFRAARPLVQAHVEVARRLDRGIVVLVMHREGEDARILAEDRGGPVSLMHVQVDDRGDAARCSGVAFEQEARDVEGPQAREQIDRCHVALLVVDASHGLTGEDKRVAARVVEAGRGLAVVLNKWDLLTPEEKEEKVWRKKVKEALAFAPWAPISYVSAKTGQRVAQPLEVALKVVEERRRRVATPELNRWLRAILGKREPPTRKGKRLKVLYATQAEATTPTFVFFVNDPELVHFSYRRYLETQLRQVFGFEGTPLRLNVRKSGRRAV